MSARRGADPVSTTRATEMRARLWPPHHAPPAHAHAVAVQAARHSEAPRAAPRPAAGPRTPCSMHHRVRQKQHYTAARMCTCRHARPWWVAETVKHKRIVSFPVNGGGRRASARAHRAAPPPGTPPHHFSRCVEPGATAVVRRLLSTSASGMVSCSPLCGSAGAVHCPPGRPAYSLPVLQRRHVRARPGRLPAPSASLTSRCRARSWWRSGPSCASGRAWWRHLCPHRWRRPLARWERAGSAGCGSGRAHAD